MKLSLIQVKKGLWILLQALVLGLLVGILPAGCLLQRPLGGLLGFTLLVLLHASELFITLPLGRQKGLSSTRTVLMTMLFGFTWWVPLKRGIHK